MGEEGTTMIKFNRILKRVAGEERGATMIEYGIIAALIAIVVAVGATTVGTKANSKFDAVATSLN